MKSARFIIPFGVLILSAALARAQGAPDFSKVEIKANKVTDKFYTLDGQGGTIGVLVGPDGVFMVDTQFAPLSDKIIPGHGPTVDRNAVITHRDMAMTIRNRVAAMVDQDKSEDEVVAAKVTADIDPKIQQAGTTGERFVRQAYGDLKAAR
jgi:hypothetical protein